MKDYRDVILAPIATEKTTNIMANGDRIVFKVHNNLVTSGLINFSSIELISQNNLIVTNKSSNLLNLNIIILSFDNFMFTFKISVNLSWKL